MTSLSSIDNGGISGIHTMPEIDVPVCMKEVVHDPREVGYDREDGFGRHRVFPATQAGELVMYARPPFSIYNLYCSVPDGNDFKWVPVMIYTSVRKLAE